MQNDVELLDMMVQDQLNQKGLYQPGPYWKGYSSRTAKAIRSDGLLNFRANSRIGKGYADSILVNPFDLSTLDSWKSKIHKRISEFTLFKRHFVDPYVKLNEKHVQKTQRYKSLYCTNILGEWFSQFSKKYTLPDTLVGNPQDTGVDPV